MQVSPSGGLEGVASPAPISHRRSASRVVPCASSRCRAARRRWQRTSAGAVRRVERRPPRMERRGAQGSVSRTAPGRASARGRGRTSGRAAMGYCERRRRAGSLPETATWRGDSRSPWMAPHLRGGFGHRPWPPDGPCTSGRGVTSCACMYHRDLNPRGCAHTWCEAATGGGLRQRHASTRPPARASSGVRGPLGGHESPLVSALLPL
jgi:hypothetical protein